jgi:RHS repeat-associated protein
LIACPVPKVGKRFNFIAAADGGVAQQQVSSSFVPLTLTDVKAPKNGYAYIYVSNQSNSDVYFDNLVATIVQGNIAEENHYYAYGLKIATLSSKKFSNTPLGDGGKNNYLYQGASSELDEDIGWNDFALRNYDAQIGRWVQMDPYDQFASPYVGMGADPVNNTDPSGGIVIDPIKTLETVVVTATRAKPVAQGISILSGLSNVTKLAGWAAKVSSIINTSIMVSQVGKPFDDWVVMKNGDLQLLRRTDDKEHRFFNEDKELMLGDLKEGEKRARYSWNVWGYDKDYQKTVKALAYSKNKFEYDDMVARGIAMGFQKTIAGRQTVEYLHDIGSKIMKEDLIMLAAPTPMNKFKIGRIIKGLSLINSGQGGGAMSRSIRVFQDIQNANSPKNAKTGIDNINVTDKNWRRGFWYEVNRLLKF